MNQVKSKNYSSEDQLVFDSLKKYRDYLSQNTDLVDFKIFNSSSVIEVRSLYNRAASPETQCKFHYLLTKNFNAKNYLEIGTNFLGLSKNSDFQFITMEGVDELSDLAQAQFETVSKPENFKILRGLYDKTFPELLKIDLKFDILFIDGNHHYEPTLHYFEKLKQKAAEISVFLFDDIYWNEEMKEAWQVIKQDHSVSYTIDLFKMGIVIIDKHNSNKAAHTKYFLTR